VSPVDGDTYFIPLTPAATGAWAGQNGNFATWDADNAEWLFADVPDHTLVYDQTASAWYEVNAGVAGVTPWVSEAPIDGAQYARKDAEWVPVVGGGGGGGGGALQFMGESVVTGSASTTLTISGLDLDSDEHYLVELKLQNAGSSLMTLRLTYNADTTVTNYWYQATGANNGSVYGGRSNDPHIGEILASSGSTFTATANLMRNAAGRVNFEGSIAQGDLSVARNFLINHSWVTTGVNVTSLTLTTTVAGGLAVGSRIRIWRLNTNTLSTIDAEITADAPLGWWKLDEASGAFADSSGNGYDLAITGTPVQAYQFSALDSNFPARRGPASTNGGQANYAGNTAIATALAPITTLTAEIWGAWTAAGYLMVMGGNGETLATNIGFMLDLAANGTVGTLWEYGAGTNGPALTQYLGGALDGKLHHIAFVKDAATLTAKMYIDGRLSAQVTYTGGQEHTGGTTGSLSIMGNPAGAVAGADGVYSGAAFYTTALTEERIQAHARALGVYG